VRFRENSVFHLNDVDVQLKASSVLTPDVSIEDFLGSKFDVRVTSILVHITVRQIGVYPLRLILTRTQREYYLTRGTSLPLERGHFTISTKVKTECPPPSDKILPSSSTGSIYDKYVHSHAQSSGSPTTALLVCAAILTLLQNHQLVVT